MNILLIGQCTLHWGRMEFGNIGNYYIIEPFIRELHATFPNATIKTTFQMSDRFIETEKIEVLPMEYYYDWKENELNEALTELASARTYNEHSFLPTTTPYIEEVLNADLVIDFSGDIWGDNADFLGKDRFFVGLCKDRVAQLLGKPTVMLAGSPGPFKNENTLKFAQEVYHSFDLVTNRENISKDILKANSFDLSKTHNLACPAFLFEPHAKDIGLDVLKDAMIPVSERPTIGFILCGWNFENGPFDKWPRVDNDYIKFAETIEYISANYDVNICLMSHSNGFPIPPEKFELIHGRDYAVTKQLQDVLNKRNKTNNLFCLDGVYDTWTTKSIISNFDMLISGRVHGAVAGLSQLVPTVIIDYGHKPKAHKLIGFAEAAGVLELVADPASVDDMLSKIKNCWNNKADWQQHLSNQIPETQQKAKENFHLLKELF